MSEWWLSYPNLLLYLNIYDWSMVNGCGCAIILIRSQVTSARQQCGLVRILRGRREHFLLACSLFFSSLWMTNYYNNYEWFTLSKLSLQIDMSTSKISYGICFCVCLLWRTLSTNVLIFKVLVYILQMRSWGWLTQGSNGYPKSSRLTRMSNQMISGLTY